jgi:hypothetical protein
VGLAAEVTAAPEVADRAAEAPDELCAEPIPITPTIAASAAPAPIAVPRTARRTNRDPLA